MSTTGRWAAPLHAQLVDDDAAHRLLSPLRMTPSSAPALRSSRGVAALLAGFQLKTQNALRRLLDERVVDEAKRRALQERHAAAPQGGPLDTDDWRTVSAALKDNEFQLRRLAGDAYPQFLALLGDPAVTDTARLAVPCEEAAPDQHSARLWRRTVGSVGHRVAGAAQYRYAGHDSPTVRGDRDLHNVLNSRDGRENESYYRRLQHAHGRTRSGSCSYADSWRDVLDPKTGLMTAPPSGQPQPATLYSAGSHTQRSGGASGDDTARAASPSHRGRSASGAAADRRFIASSASPSRSPTRRAGESAPGTGVPAVPPLPLEGRTYTQLQLAADPLQRAAADAQDLLARLRSARLC